MVHPATYLCWKFFFLCCFFDYVLKNILSINCRTAWKKLFFFHVYQLGVQHIYSWEKKLRERKRERERERERERRERQFTQLFLPSSNLSIQGNHTLHFALFFKLWPSHNFWIGFVCIIGSIIFVFSFLSKSIFFTWVGRLIDQSFFGGLKTQK